MSTPRRRPRPSFDRIGRPKTADHHISSILFKLDVNTRSKAITEAVRLGILK